MVRRQRYPGAIGTDSSVANPHADAYRHTFAKTDTDSYAGADADRDRNADPDAVADQYGNADSYADAHANADQNAHAHSDPDSDADCDATSDRHTDSQSRPGLSYITDSGVSQFHRQRRRLQRRFGGQLFYRHGQWSG